MPRSRLTEAMAVFQTGISAGIAPGRVLRRGRRRPRRRLGGVLGLRGRRRPQPGHGDAVSSGPVRLRSGRAPWLACRHDDLAQLGAASPRVSPTEVRTPRDTDDVVAAVDPRPGTAYDGQDARHRPLLHRHRRTRGDHARPGAADRHRARWTATAMTVTALAGTPLHVLNASLEALGLVAAQHGRHRRADVGRRHLDGNPRDRRPGRVAERAARGARAGHRHR